MAQTIPAIIDQPLNENRLIQLQELYQAQVEDYQTKYRQYQLALGQWKTVQTLRSLEEALTAIRVAMVARDRVLLTYTELQRETLQQTPGVELSFKDASLADLTNRVQWLRAHLATVEAAADREQLNAVADTFSNESELIQYELQRAMILIRFGQIQTIVDKADGLYDRIKTRNQSTAADTAKQVERQRAYVQVDQLRAQLVVVLQSAREGLKNVEGQSDRKRRALTYSSFSSDLEIPYTLIARYLAYLDELAKDDW
jgi:hypothetical protein